MNFFLKSIKNKLRGSYLALIVLAAAGGILSYVLLLKVKDYQSSQNDVKELVSLLSEARKAEKDFILYDRKSVTFLENATSSNTEKHREKINHMKRLLSTLQEDAVVSNLDLKAQIDTIGRGVENYARSFARLVSLMHRRGFKDHGLEGEMREYVHSLQDTKSDAEKVYAYGLRRHEKDFMLRKDEKYVTRLHILADEFQEFVSTADMAHMNQVYRATTSQSIQNYTRHFDKIVAIEKEIGLTDNTGIMGQLKAQANAIEPLTASLQNAIVRRSQKLFNDSGLVLTTSIIIILIFGIVFALALSSAISRPIILLDEVTRNVLKGNQQAAEKLASVHLKDEIGSLIKNFRFMLQSIQQNMALVTEKNAKLEKASKEEGRRRWAVEGLTLFSDLMKNEQNDLKRLSYTIISQLVKYTESAQGGIFIINDDAEQGNTTMDLKACYAFERRKKVSLQIQKGEGLVGEAWREGDTIFLTDIPENYLKIRSGLGHAPPRCILIVPIKTEQRVEGILELSAFQPFKDHVITFVEHLAERIATTVASVKMQERTTHLLEEANIMAEELRTNEEEMRQNMEELQATQEEMSRNHQEAQEERKKLEVQMGVFSHILSKVYSGLIITNSQYNISFVNKYITDRLFYAQHELLGRNLDTLIHESLPHVLQELNNDPNYLLNNFTEARMLSLKDKHGKQLIVKMVIFKVSTSSGQHFGFAFNKQDKAIGGISDSTKASTQRSTLQSQK